MHIENYIEKNFSAELRTRWQAWGEDVLRPLRFLYGERADFEQCVVNFLEIVRKGRGKRSAELRALDNERLLKPDWYQRSDQMGYIAYADRFADNLNGVAKRIDYLQELGITYLHLMPLLEPRTGENDGGYAVKDYRAVDPRLGTMADLERLTGQLRAAGISLCTDLVCNHTATDHEWAQKAKTGDQTYQDYYFMFRDRTLPDQYDKTLREIFPDFKRGNFIWHEDIQRWVWTTFNTYQWDLNYQNPTVFGEMLDIILYLANQGVEIFRMDAVAFMWKQLGTTCENLPQAHALLQAWRALSRLAAPAIILLAEAIVSPEDVVPYFGQGLATGKECELAYHNSFMVYLWSALAERKVNLMTYALQRLPIIPNSSTWATYVRLHDDIGWAITDENAAGVGLNGFLHRSFLSDFYTGTHEESFARGLVFQFNPENMDRRVNGSCASLAGLEIAIEQRDAKLVTLAIGRILLIHAFVLVYGGIPLLYMGDELGLLNDYNYVHVPEHRADSRWVQRPKMDWWFAESRHNKESIPGRIFSQLRQQIFTRKRLFQLHAQAKTTAVYTYNEQVFGLLRHSPRGNILALGNFSEGYQYVTGQRLQEIGFGGALYDHLGERAFNGRYGVTLEPFQAMWLETVAH